MLRSIVLVAALVLHWAAQASECNTREIDPNPRVNGWGINAQNHRFISDKNAGIDSANVGQLEVKWVYALPETDSPRFLPYISSDTVFITDGDERVLALSRDSGCQKWVFEAGSAVRTALTYLAVGESHLLVFGTMSAELIAVDVLTGEEQWRTLASEHPKAMISGSPVAYGVRIFQPVSSWELAWAVNPFYGCCTFRGPIVALDATSGQLQWRNHTIQTEPTVFRPRLILPDLMGPSGAPVWSQPTVDAKRQRIYVGTGENYSSPANDTSDAILAFDMRTGELLWKQQFLANDAWNVACELPIDFNCPDERGQDLDFGAPPILLSIDGKDVILAGQKSGYIYALDPNDNGKLLWRQKPGNGGKAGGIHFAMAVDPARAMLFVPISDRDVGFYGDNPPGTPQPSLQAFNALTGERLWRTDAPGDCLADEEEIDKCFVGFSAAPTATDSLVFAPTLDGVIRAFDSHTGKEIWKHNTLRSYEAVNGGNANGGSIDFGGVFVDGGELFVSSGYGLVGQMPGNAFIVMSVKP